jgi:hypothetical protein
MHEKSILTQLYYRAPRRRSISRSIDRKAKGLVDGHAPQTNPAGGSRLLTGIVRPVFLPIASKASSIESKA